MLIDYAVTKVGDLAVLLHNFIDGIVDHDQSPRLNGAASYSPEEKKHNFISATIRS